MVKSMTGYGKAETEINSKKITIEIRSLNSKQLDLSVKMPGAYRPLEYEIRNRVSKEMQRGKVDVFVSVETSGASLSANINKELFSAYYNDLYAIALAGEPAGNADGLKAAIVPAILRMPDVVSAENSSVSDEEQAALLGAVDAAIKHIGEFRIQEGATLMNDILKRVDKIQAYKEEVIPFEGRRIDVIKNRIRESIASLGVGLDENRLEQEMIFYVEKLDITEEKVRLDNHCKYFREVSGEEENVGRKLGFIAQEIGREINTMGSKANDSDIQKLVVQMKDELEKIKEQILNIL